MRTRHFVIFLLLLGSFLLMSNQLLEVVSGSRLEEGTTTPTLSLSASSDPQPLTDPINVELSITGATDLNLGAFEFDLAYDDSLVEVTGITLQDGSIGKTSNCNADTARCAVAFAPRDQGDATSIGAYSYGTGAATNQNGVLALIHLQPKGEPGAVLLEIKNALLSDVDGGSPSTPESEGTGLILAEQKTAAMNINRSWNHIALPLNLGASYTAENLCDEINSQGGTLKEIDRWHNGGWQGHICDRPFNDFTLVLGNSYFIRSDDVNTWTMAGYDVTDPIALELQEGWNSISLPHTDGYTAESLCDELIAQGVDAVEIDGWHNSGWQGHVCGLPFNDFPIEHDTGYFVKSNSAGSVVPPTVE